MPETVKSVRNHPNFTFVFFSWQPQAALADMLDSAKYLKNGKIVEVAPGGALLDAFVPVNIFPGFNFVGCPNQDATVYGKAYGIEEDAHTVFRGTLRYKVKFC